MLKCQEKLPVVANLLGTITAKFLQKPAPTWIDNFLFPKGIFKGGICFLVPWRVYVSTSAHQNVVYKKNILWRLKSTSRWWFETFFVFTTTWENDPIWLIFFQLGWNHQLDIANTNSNWGSTAPRRGAKVRRNLRPLCLWYGICRDAQLHWVVILLTMVLCYQFPPISWNLGYKNNILKKNEWNTNSQGQTVKKMNEK